MCNFVILMFSLIGLNLSQKNGFALLDTPLVFVSPQTQAGLAAGSTFRDSVYYMESTTSPNLYGFDVKLYFDPSVISCDRIVDTTALSNGGSVFWVMKQINNTEGWLWVACACMYPNPGLNGNGKLFSIVWRVVVSSRGSILHLGDTDMASPSAQPIPHKKADGYYNPPAILILSPADGEYWLRGSSHNINWLTAGITGNVKIELYKGGILNSSISSSTQNDSVHSWSIPAAQEPGSDYKVKITSISAPSIYTYSNTNFSICQNVQVVLPNGGESWTGSQSYSITWNASGGGGNVRMEYSTNGGSSWNTIIESTLDDGSHLWTLPNTPTTQGRIKVTHLSCIPTNSDASDGNFTIRAIKVTSPNDYYVTWLIGKTYEIEWITTVSGYVKLELYKGGSLSQTIADNTENDSLYLWTIPTSCTPATNYKVKITVNSEPSINDYSDTTFTICRQIQILYPNGGEWLRVDSTYDIKWGTTGISGNVTIKYRTGASWYVISSGTPDDGLYSWTVPNTPATQAKMDIYYQYVAATEDSSDATFTIATGPPGVEEVNKAESQKLKAEIYPNPFSQKTTIRHWIPDPGFWQKSGVSTSIQYPASSIQIYDITGRLVKSFGSGDPLHGEGRGEPKLPELNNSITQRTQVTQVWDGRDDMGTLLPNGVYFCKLRAGKENITKQMLLIR